MIRFEKVDNIRKVFFRIVVGDLLRAYHGKSEMGAYILGFCLIDQLASLNKYIENEEIRSPSEKYKLFVEKYYLQSLGYNSSLDKKHFIYKTRCHLIHQYAWDKDENRRQKDRNIGVSNMVAKENEHLNLSKNKDGKGQRIIQYNKERFIADLICLTWNFFEEIIRPGNNEKKNNLIKKIDSDEYRWYFLIEYEMSEVEGSNYKDLDNNDYVSKIFAIFDRVNRSSQKIDVQSDLYKRVLSEVKKGKKVRELTLSEIKKNIKEHLYNELKYLLCAATGWYAYQKEVVRSGQVKADKKFEEHFSVYRMNSAFLHARSLFEFFTAKKKKKETRNLTWENFGAKKLNSKNIYNKYKDSLHRYLIHFQDRSVASNKCLNRKILLFAKEILRLWDDFSKMDEMKEYKDSLNKARDQAFCDAKETADRYGLHFLFEQSQYKLSEEEEKIIEKSFNSRTL